MTASQLSGAKTSVARHTAFDHDETALYPARPSVDRANGLRVWLSGDPTPYIDLVQGYSTTIFGHCDHEVATVAAEALSTADHVSGMTSQPREELANLLSQLSPVPGGRVYFDIGGAHIVSMAIRLARRVTGRTRLLALCNAFHGYSTEGEVLSAAFIGEAPATPEEACGIDLVQVGSEEVFPMLASRRYAAFLIEPLQGANGLAELPQHWVGDTARACAASDTLLIADEVQVGLGRTGTFAAVDRYGVTPDVLVFGKALCAGVFPLSAMIVAQDVYERLPNWPASALGSTFSCSPFGCAVGTHVIRRVKRLLDDKRIQELGTSLSRRLHPLVGRAGITAVRGYGLGIAVDFVDAAAARRYAESAFQRWLLVAVSGVTKDVIKLYPPYTTTDQEAVVIADALEAVVAAIE
jgi:acetylornithine/succinyldiaminopimelate/putrescine aminotransferase